MASFTLSPNLINGELINLRQTLQSYEKKVQQFVHIIISTIFLAHCYTFDFIFTVLQLIALKPAVRPEDEKGSSLSKLLRDPYILIAAGKCALLYLMFCTWNGIPKFYTGGYGVPLLRGLVRCRLILSVQNSVAIAGSLLFIGHPQECFEPFVPEIKREIRKLIFNNGNRT